MRKHLLPLLPITLFVLAPLAAPAIAVERTLTLDPTRTEVTFELGATGHDVCFIHPKPSVWFPVSGNGVLIELVQAPPELVARYAAEARDR